MQTASPTHATPTLHLVCGKIGAGKSTLCRQLAQAPGTVLISEDAWLAGLYPAEIRSIADYLLRADLLRTVLTPHLQALLRAGVSVVVVCGASLLIPSPAPGTGSNPTVDAWHAGACVSPSFCWSCW